VTSSRGATFAVPQEVARLTQEHLRAKGQEMSEGVVLWLGTFEPPRITRAVVPEQETSMGRFRVPLRARQELSRELTGSGQVLVAQVHSHPSAAFHSEVDDAEAIPRRAGAYSLVLPDFGARAHLLEGAALYRLDQSGRWRDAPLSTLSISDSLATLMPATRKRTLWRRLTDLLRSSGRSSI
jgi:hypothetical protein